MTAELSQRACAHPERVLAARKIPIGIRSVSARTVVLVKDSSPRIPGVAAVDGYGGTVAVEVRLSAL
jgi:hypothetical protein